jgi:hypothetical protein
MESVSAAQLWTGRVLSGVVFLLLLADAVAKLLKAGPAVAGTVGLGYPEGLVVPVGALLIAGAALYAIPRTSLLGAIYLTGYLGGAVATHVRIGNPLFTHVLSGVYVAALMWGGLVLRTPRLLSLLAGR